MATKSHGTPENDRRCVVFRGVALQGPAPKLVFTRGRNVSAAENDESCLHFTVSLEADGLASEVPTFIHVETFCQFVDDFFSICSGQKRSAELATERAGGRVDAVGQGGTVLIRGKIGAPYLGWPRMLSNYELATDHRGTFFGSIVFAFVLDHEYMSIMRLQVDEFIKPE